MKTAPQQKLYINWVSVRATKFAPDSYRGLHSGQLANGYSCED